MSVSPTRKNPVVDGQPKQPKIAYTEQLSNSGTLSTHMPSKTVPCGFSLYTRVLAWGCIINSVWAVYYCPLYCTSAQQTISLVCMHTQERHSIYVLIKKITRYMKGVLLE